ncbi:hypothetical protein B0T44_10020 [Nocardia donostiensis]|uniref:Uncharacterized protein n=1 Tax=Nocardia donostiensis TaxID=1538463 RepID=A0A1V2TFR5_9NOCA|nr:hypothetical protein B0T46_12960 [Nocardia donostiensis]OQS14516.1 hypothetical protein B0T36_13375 [Nocardia donostiensis]OQS20602.1 hypothetical protein B0T44_10020 [Nocardia donostiensis]
MLLPVVRTTEIVRVNCARQRVLPGIRPRRLQMRFDGCTVGMRVSLPCRGAVVGLRDPPV